jgi:hypothetical protein
MHMPTTDIANDNLLAALLVIGRRFHATVRHEQTRRNDYSPFAADGMWVWSRGAGSGKATAAGCSARPAGAL